MTRSSESWTCSPPLYLMKPSLRNLFMKKLAATGGADHFRESSLGNAGDNVLGLFVVAVTSDQEECPGEAFLTGIKKLINEIFLDSDVPFEHVSDETVRKLAFFMNDSNHFRFFNPENGYGSEGNGGGDAKGLSSDAAFSEKIARTQDGDDRFFSGGGTDDNFYGT